jgi:AcrR family transcriptional regulator
VRHIDGKTISVVLSQVMTLVSEVPEATPAVSVPVAAPGVEQRAIEATLACIARHGLSKTTIDDVAREGGFSRATLYRYFGGKRDLVERVVHHEIERVTRDLLAAADSAETLEDAVTAMFVTGGRELADNAALRFVADFEPERLLPHLTFSGGDVFLRDSSVALAPALERFLGERAPRAAEWITRIGLILWFSPTAPVSLSDGRALRAYVHEFVVPAILPPAIHPAVSDPVSPVPNPPLRDL